MTAIRKAMIMGAGLGSRMRPLTDKLPKPLVPFMGKPLIDHALERLEAAGVEEVVVNLHYKADILESHLKRRAHPRIVFSDERDALLDTGGGLKKARPLFGEEPILVMNSDTVWAEGMTPVMERMKAFWDPARMDALLMLAPAVTTIGECRLGDFNMDGDARLIRRKEAHVAPFMFAGVQIFHPRLLDGAPDGPFSTNLLWDKAAEEGRLFGLRLDGVWMHVGTPHDLKEAERFMQEL
ncbi:nucleotidyltransferase family protein [Tepidicaulis sp. LMO-SS28]|uniref:nucleotidyltransferase family protein n=1 Tax=Tepidicaulis sp. LMO-SS28 TaxID=3447455 RepID=UPI003EE067CF